ANLSGTYLRPGGGTAAFSETLTSESHIEPRSLTFALGTRVSERFSIGASADIYLGKAVSETRQNITWQDYPDFDSPQTAVRSQDVLVLDTTAFSGFGLTGGVMYNGDQLDVGLLVRAPFSFESTTDQKFFTLTSYAGLPQPDQSDTTFIDDQLIKYDLPIMFALGLSYNLTENLMWAFDAEYRGFEGRDAERRTEINISEDTETFETLELNWQNVFTFRSGLEYMWETGSSAFPLVPLRAGFAYVPIPTPNAALNPNATSGDDLFDYSSTSGYNITAGFGLWWELVTIDIAYVYGSLDRESVVQLGTDMSNIEFIPVETRNRTHDLTLTFTGYF
ncbi:hypothetical protein GF420_10460, partial [candidate division GN15 bacterium]|nr:hypothetical protein [candidate division GN15 bacterium]